MKLKRAVFFRSPDCSQTCLIGQQLNDACDTCICESSTIQGRVLSASGNPVSYADITTETAPTRVIAQSNSTGFFTLDDTCISTKVIVTREGFQDTVVELTATSQTIYMELEGELKIKKVQVGNDHEKAQSGEIYTPKNRGGKNLIDN